jgi:hypothetical protein
MLRTLHDLKHTTIGATDGPIGKVRDAYFDDQHWTMRYLVVDTGGWLSRQVLITPLAIERVDWNGERIEVRMTREQVRNSPDIDTDKPVSRQHEMLYLNYYGLPHYWSGPMLWGPTASPLGIGDIRSEPLRTGHRMQSLEEMSDQNDPHLRSCASVSGYHVEANDGAIGHIADYLFDDDTWTLRYLVIDTRNWLPGKRVVISSEWVERVSWNERKAYVSMSKQSIRDAPEYDRDLTIRDTPELGVPNRPMRDDDIRQRTGRH